MANLSNINNKLLVGTNGEVRIGDTATVANVKLRVKQTAQQWTAQFVNTDSSVAYGISIDTSASSYGVAGTLQCYTNAGGGFIVRNDSRVGIGTTGPLALLNIEGSNNQDQNDYAQLYIKGTGTYPDDIAGIVLDSVGSHQSHVRFSNNGSPKFQLRYNQGSNTIDKLTFYSFTQGNDMMTLDGATGNVGIGTYSPSATLELNSTTGNAAKLRVGRQTTATNYLELGTNGGDSVINAIGIAGVNATLVFNRSTTTTTTESMRINGSGNVGIGTTDPSTKLEVVDTFSVQRTSTDNEGFYVTVSGADANAIVETFYQEDSNSLYGFSKKYDGSTNLYQEFIHDNSATGTEVYRVNRSTKNTSILNGNVGIGTTTPAAKLDVEGGGRFEGNVGIGTAPTSRQLSVFRTTAGSIANFLHYTDSSNFQGLYIQVSQTTDMVTLQSSGASGGGFIFSSGNTEKIRFTATGNVGIGTTSPSAKLHITEQAESNYFIKLTGTLGTGNTYGFKTNGGNSQVLSLYDVTSTNRLAVFGDTEIQFATTGTSRLYIGSSGNVGIGTTSPGAKLEVRSDGSAAVGAEIRLQHANNNTNDVVSTVNFANNAGSVGMIQAGTAGANNTGYIALFTDIAGSSSERMRIHTNGNVGIGITTPSKLLHLLGADATVQIQGSGTGSDAGVDFFPRDGSNVAHLQSIKGVDSSLTFLTGGNSGNSYVPTEKMRITSGGDLLVGTTGIPNGTSIYGAAFVPLADDRVSLLTSTSATTAQTLIAFYNPNGQIGTIRTSGSSTSYNTSSDYRLKEDLQDFNGLDKVSKIPVYDFKWKTDESRSYGVMAHELQEVLPQAVSGDKDAEEMQSVDYSKIVPLLVKSIQELKAEIELLKSK